MISVLPLVWLNGRSVTLDGGTFDSVTQDSILAQIGIVSRDTVLFNPTIRENDRLARAGSANAEVEAAAGAAEIHDFHSDAAAWL